MILNAVPLLCYNVAVKELHIRTQQLVTSLGSNQTVSLCSELFSGVGSECGSQAVLLPTGFPQQFLEVFRSHFECLSLRKCLNIFPHSCTNLYVKEKLLSSEDAGGS